MAPWEGLSEFRHAVRLCGDRGVLRVRCAEGNWARRDGTERNIRLKRLPWSRPLNSYAELCRVYREADERVVLREVADVVEWARG